MTIVNLDSPSADPFGDGTSHAALAKLFDAIRRAAESTSEPCCQDDFTGNRSGELTFTAPASR